MRYRLKAVRQGVELLDAKFGENWDERIDLDTLQIHSTCGCVLAQINGGPTHTRTGTSRYGRMLGKLKLGWHEAKNFGFSASADDDKAWDALQAEWKRVIRRRREARAERIAA